MLKDVFVSSCGDIIQMCQWRGVHSMRSRVYVTVGRPSVCPSISLSRRSTATWRSAGLLLSAQQAGDTDWQLRVRTCCECRDAGASTQQQTWRASQPRADEESSTKTCYDCRYANNSHPNEEALKALSPKLYRLLYSSVLNARMPVHYSNETDQVNLNHWFQLWIYCAYRCSHIQQKPSHTLVTWWT